MTKQTALDWYWDKIKSHFEHDGDLLETATFTLAIAKQKELEQMKISFCKGYDRCEWENSVGSYYEEEPSDFDNYYNETFNK